MPLILGISTVIVIAAFSPRVSDAQGAPAPRSPSVGVQPLAPKPATSSRFRLRTAAEVEYDDNVFLLADTKKNNLDVPSASAQASGRYTDMKSASDVIATLSAAAPLRFPGAMGRSIDLVPAVAYHAYLQNGQRSHVTLGLSAEQDLPRGSHLRVRAGMTPSYFAKNYLFDAVDGDASGTITSDERRYRPGTYRETDISADYRIRLDKSSGKSPFGASLQVGGGYYGRAYKEPFKGRDLSGPTAGVKLLGELTRRVGLDVEYGFASLNSDVTSQVMILDEPDFGRDFNGNSTITESNVRVDGQVDRSRREHALGARMKFEATKRVDFTLEGERRFRSYTSEEPLDAANNGRRDTRDQVAAELSAGLRSGIRLMTRASYTQQSLNRSQDLGGTGEVDDYSRIQFAAGVRYTF